MRRLLFLLLVLLSSGHAIAQAPPPPPLLSPFADNQAWMLVRDYVYVIGSTQTEIRVPKGFVTDFASIPKSRWWWRSPNDFYSRAAIVHDYLSWTQKCTRLQADNLMLIAMKESDVSSSTQFFVYRGVRLGGESSWDENRTKRAAGELRIVPPEQAELPASVTWSDYRNLLQARGFSEPTPELSASFCLYGDSVAVP